MDNEIKIFLDSGAFSCWSKNIKIDIKEYIEFIKNHQEYLEVYSVLDDITNPEITLENQNIMENDGLHPLPCFHYGEDIQYLKHYLDNYDYVALGGMVPISNKDLVIWLDDIFSNYVCNNPDGFPTCKIHGFGLTSLKLMLRYPWYSVDSTSWVITSRMGSIYVPREKNGEWIYDEDSWKIVVSSRSPNKNIIGKHIDTLSISAKKTILDYINQKGYELGKSEFRHVSAKKYELEENENWVGAELEDQTRLVETMRSLGLCNDYKSRDELNIIYFLDLEKNMEKWPWAFKQKGVKKFEL